MTSDNGSRVVGAAIAATAVVALPTLLVGGLAVLIQRDLGFGEAELGAAVATSFACAALTAIPAGRLAEHIGPRRTTLVGLAFGTAALLGIGLVSGEWWHVLVFLGMAGVGITTVQVGLNVLLARAVPRERQGLAYGAKQAAVPLASMLAGLALPIVGLTIDWSAAFVLGALAVPLVALVLPDAARPPASDHAVRGGSLTGGLVLLAAGVALASAGGNSTPAFLVPSLVDRGIEPAAAGLMLAVASVAGIVVRVASGWVSDRVGRGALVGVMGMVAVGVVGYLGLAATDDVALLVPAAILALGGGWGWGGLVPLAVARSVAGAPGRAMGIVQVGPMTGAVFGPLAFGALAEGIGFAAGWTAMAVLAGLGVLTIAASRWLLRRGRAEATAS